MRPWRTQRGLHHRGHYLRNDLRLRCRRFGPNEDSLRKQVGLDIAKPGDLNRFNGSFVDPGTLTSKQVFLLRKSRSKQLGVRGEYGR